MSNIIFSIIIPTYNTSRTITQAVKSVIEQDFTGGLEILIIDGLSTDNTIDTVKSFQDNRIKIISGKDTGIYDAMNKGVKLAQGEFIYFLGSDDKLFDASVLTKVEANIDESIDVIYGNVWSSRWGGNYDGEFTVDKIIHKNICHQAIFIRRHVFLDIGYFNLKYPILADWEHNWRWFFNPSIKKKFINLTIADYADGGISSKNGDCCPFLRERISILKRYLNYGTWVSIKQKELISIERQLKFERKYLQFFLHKIFRLSQRFRHFIGLKLLY